MGDDGPTEGWLFFKSEDWGISLGGARNDYRYPWELQKAFFFGGGGPLQDNSTQRSIAVKAKDTGIVRYRLDGQNTLGW